MEITRISNGFSSRANPFVHTETFGLDDAIYELKSFHDADGLFGNSILTCAEFGPEDNSRLGTMMADIQKKILAGSGFDFLLEEFGNGTAPRTKPVEGHPKVKAAWDLRDAVLQMLRLRYDEPLPQISSSPAVKPKYPSSK